MCFRYLFKQQRLERVEGFKPHIYNFNTKTAISVPVIFVMTIYVTDIECHKLYKNSPILLLSLNVG